MRLADYNNEYKGSKAFKLGMKKIIFLKIALVYPIFNKIYAKKELDSISFSYQKKCFKYCEFLL